MKNLPQVTFPKFVTDGRSYEIDQRIKAILAEGLSIYRVDVEALKRLRPDVIITQVQCEVCAVSLRDVETALFQFTDYHPRIVSINPNSLADIWNDFRNIAAAIDRTDAGERLVKSIVEVFRQTEAELRVKARRVPRVACIEWLDPLMAAGNWMPELVKLAGGVNLFGEPGKHSPWMSFADLLESDADIILLLPCGFDIERTERELADVFAKFPWQETRAFREGQAFILDGNSFFNRSGPRLKESLEILVEIFHPELRQKPPSPGWKRVPEIIFRELSH